MVNRTNEEVPAADDVVLYEERDTIAIVRLNRPAKRNAISTELTGRLRKAFTELPEKIRVVVLTTSSDQFCAGLDLSQHQLAKPFESVLFSRASHDLFDGIKHCGRPVIAAMPGAVIGGGLEMAAVTHIRIAEPSTFYQLPEGRRAIFLGGGGTVNISRIIGADRVREMMLTGRRVDAAMGLQWGLSHYLVGPGETLAAALEIAEKVAANAPVSNYMMLHAIDLISDMPPEAGLFTESLAQALTLTSDDAVKGMEAFLRHKKDASF